VNRRRLPRVAVVGRPNVGKSTLFNRVVRRGVAVVDDLPGVTRDRREADASWVEVPFRLVDTGGLVPSTSDSMEAAVLEQTRLAVAEADVILFLIDVREGLTALDREIAEELRPSSDRVIVVANKAEGPARELAGLEAAELGLGEPHVISGEHGQGVGDLLDALVARLPRRGAVAETGPGYSFTLVGRPNVGKSSLANRLLGQPRLVVHPQAGTTRDAIDVPFRYDGDEFVLVDTAGLRRRSHVARGVEFYSTLRTRRSLERCDVGVLVLDAAEPLTAQDARIAGLILEAGKPSLLLFNKWDLVEKETGTTEHMTRDLREAYPLMAESPVLFVSAVTGLRVSRIPARVRELAEEARRRIATHELNAILQEAVEAVPPPVRRNGKPFRFYYVTQTGEAPPTLVVFSNEGKGVPTAYRSYLRNAFRARLGLRSTPIRLEFRTRERTRT
jgi:GTP-binding protein